MGKKYAIKNLEEAKEYIVDPIVSSNLIKTYIIIGKALKYNDYNLNKTLGLIDSNKLKSSVTLFYYACQSLKNNHIFVRNSNIIDQLHSQLGDCPLTCKILTNAQSSFQ